jgi:hypothetical protein
VAEVRDHLLEATERVVDDCADPADAEGVAVRTFGRPSLVAGRFVESGLWLSVSPLPSRLPERAPRPLTSGDPRTSSPGT